MKLLGQSGRIDAGRVNFWPLIVPPACIALWWPILAIAFNSHVATIFAIVATCLLVIVVALAALADALGIEDGLLHIDESELTLLDEEALSQKASG
ncbi:MAG TPA: hypothetical protein VEI05_03230 [Burkholderiaceae bacterium]|nr:hypothetical protein [Burkholderiaceae bacterium]